MGRLRSADGGTLFLDEIGEIPFELQSNCCGRFRKGSSSALERSGPGASMFGSWRLPIAA